MAFATGFLTLAEPLLPMNRRTFVSSALATGAAVFGGIATLKGQSATAASGQPKFKLGYGPHPGMFKESAGADVLDQIRFVADQGFTAWEDNGMMGRPPAEQEAIGRLLAEKGMQMGVFVAYANFEEPTFAKPDARRNNMVNWWMATAQAAGYEKLFPGLMTYFYTAEYYDANTESIGRTVDALIKAKRPIKGFLHMGASILDHDTWDRLGEIKAPTLLMGGEEDIITPPRHMQEMARRMPNAEARMFPKTLHGFMVEKPETFAMIPEFFRRH